MKASVRRRLYLALSAALWMLPGAAPAADIDHRVARDTSGIYSLQDAVPVTLALAAAGCALWQGSTDRLGKTCWEAGESALASAVLAEGLQFITARRGPDVTADPNHWFSGGKGSFPSTHVSVTTAAVTPFIFEYAHDQPWIALLAVVPAYEMVARVKARQHWQTDVLAGAVLGAAVGSLEAKHGSPLTLRLLPGGAFVGYQHSF